MYKFGVVFQYGASGCKSRDHKWEEVDSDQRQSSENRLEENVDKKKVIRAICF